MGLVGVSVQCAQRWLRGTPAFSSVPQGGSDCTDEVVDLVYAWLSVLVVSASLRA